MNIKQSYCPHCKSLSLVREGTGGYCLLCGRRYYADGRSYVSATREMGRLTGGGRPERRPFVRGK